MLGFLGDKFESSFWILVRHDPLFNKTTLEQRQKNTGLFSKKWKHSLNPKSQTLAVLQESSHPKGVPQNSQRVHVPNN